jgi:hypothetical protein
MHKGMLHTWGEMITCITELHGGPKAKKSAGRGPEGGWDGQGVCSGAIGTKSSVRHACKLCTMGRSSGGLLERRG